MNEIVETKHEVGRRLAVVSFPWHHEDVADRLQEAFGTVLLSLGARGIRASGPAVGCYERNADGFTVSAGFVVDEEVPADGPVHTIALPPGDTLSVRHIGPYERLSEAYQAIQDHAASHHLVLHCDVMWEEYLSEPGVDPNLVQTRVTWPATHANLALATH